MTPAEAVKHIRVLTEFLTEDAQKEALWRTVREVQNILAQVKETPEVPVMSAGFSSRSRS
nr:hypothetical protein [Methylobacterium sp. ZNC0032]